MLWLGQPGTECYSHAPLQHIAGGVYQLLRDSSEGPALHLPQLDRQHLKQVPVVVMTSSNEERDVVESYRLGVNSYIVKPIEFSAFLDTVAKIGLYWVVTNRVPQQ